MARVAIIGGGISGMCSAYLLSTRHEVVLFESQDYLGGHTHTHSIPLNHQTWNIDSGFIVYNDKTYPNFIKFLNRLDVQGRPTTMSFSVRSDAENVEYNGTNINSLFAQRANLLRPRFWRMIQGILRFNKDCKSLLKEPPSNTTLGAFISAHKYSKEFIDWYIKPMAAAVWSTGTSGILEMPIYFLARFFENHGFLNIDDRPQWYTVAGGSKTYANRVLKLLESKIQLRSPVEKIIRREKDVSIATASGDIQTFDYVIVCAHSCDALRMLDQPEPQEKRILGNIQWSKNSILLHTDTRILPRRKLAWAAWNYHLFGDQRDFGNKAVVSYNMNMLQGLNAPETFIVSLNSEDLIDPFKVLKKVNYEHPIFDERATKAQADWDILCPAESRIKYAGAYWFNGFHEDGVNSAIRAVNSIDAELCL